MKYKICFEVENELIWAVLLSLTALHSNKGDKDAFDLYSEAVKTALEDDKEEYEEELRSMRGIICFREITICFCDLLTVSESGW